MGSQRNLRTIVVGLVLTAVLGSPERAIAAPFPGTLAWELRADLPTGAYGAAGGVIDGMLLVSQGYRGGSSSQLSIYDPAQGKTSSRTTVRPTGAAGFWPHLTLVSGTAYLSSATIKAATASIPFNQLFVDARPAP